jgi:AraC-like DNA-binding protein
LEADVELSSLDRLLATLDVQLHGFAVCDVQTGSRLVFDAMNVVVIHYVLAGEGLLEVDGAAAARIAAGSILVVPANRAQALVAGEAASTDVPAADNCAAVVDGLLKFDAAGGEPGQLRTICATLTATYGGSFGLFDNLVRPIVDDATEIPAVRAAFQTLADERAAPDLGTHALTGAVMKQCLVLLVRRHLQRGSSSSPFFAALADARLAKAVSLVLQRPAARLTLADLAAEAGMSRTAFAKAFNDAFDQTPMDFVQKARLHRAAQLLAATELPVKVVAASLGFASRSHFSRAFSRAYGADPSTYRKRHDRNAIELPANAGRSWLSKMSEE